MRLVLAADSTYGNTRRVAEAIADGWSVGPHDPPTPIRDLDARRLDSEALLVVGAPTHAHGVAPTTWTALERIPSDRFHDLRVATFDTRYDRSRWLTGSAAHDLEKALVARGARSVAPPESFFVVGRDGPLESGELERARAWGARLREIVSAPTRPLLVAGNRV